MRTSIRRRSMGFALATAGAALVAAGVLAPVAFAPPYVPPPQTGPPSPVCVPSEAWADTARGTFELRGASTECYVPGRPGEPPGRAIIDHAGGPPTLILREGETVTFGFQAVPESVVTLITRAANGTRRGPVYRLSPYTTTWRARPGQGTMTISTTQWVHTESVGLPVHIERATYLVRYRTVTR